MFKKFFLIAAALTATLTAGAQLQFFPDKEGTVLTYSQADTESKSEATVTEKVTAVKTDGTVTTVTIEHHYTDKSNPMLTLDLTASDSQTFNSADSVTTLNILDGETFRQNMISMIETAMQQAGQPLSSSDKAELEKGVKVKGSITLPLSPNVVEGTTFHNSSIRCDMGPQYIKVLMCKGKYLGKETVEVPAGKFDCQKVSYELRYTGSEIPNEKVTTWYAPGIGEVKSESADKSGKVTKTTLLTSVK